jgi:phosphoglycolate phosphatase
MKRAFPLSVSAVTIDLDGTLADTIPDLAAGANAMLAELGSAALPVERIRTFVGKGIPKLVERTLAEAFGDAGLMERALPVFERHYTNANGRHSRIYPGVIEGLRALRDMKVPLACVTNKSGRFTAPLLEQLGLATYFEQVVAGDTLPKKKPDPDQLLHASRAFGIAPATMLMIGDSVNDAQAARAAGCPVFCVPYGYNEGRDVRELDVDAIVESLVEATRLIRKLAGKA